jgi:hypothetical protein
MHVVRRAFYCLRWKLYHTPTAGEKIGAQLSCSSTTFAFSHLWSRKTLALSKFLSPSAADAEEISISRELFSSFSLAL